MKKNENKNINYIVKFMLLFQLIPGHRKIRYYSSTDTVRPRPTHCRSASLPVNALSDTPHDPATGAIDIPVMRSHSSNPLAPPYRSPKTDPVVISDSREYAKASVGEETAIYISKGKGRILFILL